MLTVMFCCSLLFIFLMLQFRIRCKSPRSATWPITCNGQC